MSGVRSGGTTLAGRDDEGLSAELQLQQKVLVVVGVETAGS